MDDKTIRQKIRTFITRELIRDEDYDLAFDVLAAGIARAGDVPVLLINEPMFVSDGQNSDVRYNSFYPIWAYDLYREMLMETAVTHNWPYLDLWDSISPEEFTDTPVHLTPAGTANAGAVINQLMAELP